MTLSPKAGRRIHLALAGFWFAQMVACLVVVDRDWKLYLLEISLWANFATHIAGWSAERPSELAE